MKEPAPACPVTAPQRCVSLRQFLHLQLFLQHGWFSIFPLQLCLQRCGRGGAQQPLPPAYLQPVGGLKPGKAPEFEQAPRRAVSMLPALFFFFFLLFVPKKAVVVVLWFSLCFLVCLFVYFASLFVSLVVCFFVGWFSVRLICVCCFLCLFVVSCRVVSCRVVSCVVVGWLVG